MPEVSVILPVYNAELYLEAAIESILQQTFTDLELLIWDDGSTDRSQAIVKRFAEQDARVKLYGGFNVGVAAALNKLATAASGSWLFRMDADDVSRHDRIEKQLDYCKLKNLDICGSYIAYTDKKKIRKYPVTDGELKSGMYFWGKTFAHPTVAFSRRVFDFMQYNENYRAAQDIDFWLRSLAIEGIRLGNFPEPLLYYRRHEGQITERRRSEQDAVTKAALKAAIENIFPKLTQRQFDCHVKAQRKNGLEFTDIKEYLEFIEELNTIIVKKYGEHGALAKWCADVLRKNRRLTLAILRHRPRSIGFFSLLSKAVLS